jgi:Ca2+-binding EF-hand superfamily protein
MKTEAQGAISENRLAEAFDRLDLDDSGYITTDELVNFSAIKLQRKKSMQS